MVIEIKEPQGTISEIKICKHKNGIWFETDRESYVVLSKSDAIKIVTTLQKVVLS